MPKLEAAVGGEGQFDAKFLRAGDQIVTTMDDELMMPHSVLGDAEGIGELIIDLRASDPREVDGGLISINHSRKRIKLMRQSSDFQIPADAEARNITGAKVHAIFPEYDIQTPPEFTVYET